MKVIKVKQIKCNAFKKKMIGYYELITSEYILYILCEYVIAVGRLVKFPSRKKGVKPEKKTFLIRKFLINLHLLYI